MATAGASALAYLADAALPAGIYRLTFGLAAVAALGALLPLRRVGATAAG